ncbi:MAG: chemotaxis protein CheW [Sphingomonas sp. 28-66-16]|nr:MAG: chemotaxis protein CheW [Sphingomonas sp. 28-66-16]
MTEKLFLIAQIADRAVAIGSDQVESVVDIAEIVPVPGAAPEVRGLAALRSRVVMVIDTCLALGLPASRHPPSRAVITFVDGHHYAILVDALEDVAPFSIGPVGGGIALEGGWRRAGCGIVDRDGDPMLAIDLRTIIPCLAPA